MPDLSEYMAQQDAHEALTYILDLVHGDINRASSNTYHRDGPPDAGEAMLKHKVARPERIIVIGLFAILYFVQIP